MILKYIKYKSLIADTLFPAEEGCTDYIRCFNNAMVYGTCPEGHIFNCDSECILGDPDNCPVCTL